jgi:hypothetical protein
MDAKTVLTGAGGMGRDDSCDPDGAKVLLVDVAILQPVEICLFVRCDAQECVALLLSFGRLFRLSSRQTSARARILSSSTQGQALRGAAAYRLTAAQCPT